MPLSALKYKRIAANKTTSHPEINVGENHRRFSLQINARETFAGLAFQTGTIALNCFCNRKSSLNRQGLQIC